MSWKTCLGDRETLAVEAERKVPFGTEQVWAMFGCWCKQFIVVDVTCFAGFDGGFRLWDDNNLLV